MTVAPSRRRRLALVVAGSALVAALVAGAVVVSWSTDARAAAAAAGIDRWHDEHDAAGCGLEVRIVRAVALQDRAADVLDAAADVEHAAELLGERQRSAFGLGRSDLLGSLAAGDFVTADDRAVAERWTTAADRASDPAAFDVLGACVAAAAAARPALTVDAGADELERELRRLGDPRDFDDARIDGLEAAIARFAPVAIAVAESRTDPAAMRDAFAIVPEELRAPLDAADARVAALLALLADERGPADVLDLVEGVTLHVASARAADAWRLEAEGRAEAAAAAAVAAQRAREAVRQAAPRPITDPSPLPPAGLLPTLPPEAPSLPGPTDPGPPGESGQGLGDALPAPPEEPGLTEPGPTDPGTPDPSPTDPPPTPEPSLEPAPTTPPTPDPSAPPAPTPLPTP
ncbi:hypothetical protein LG314_04530 [Agrococcus terreus]|uniref:hypothetical protein n=1 Tax=Agrococcus terreus TaxID=574649 RepID=UPI00384DA500